MRFAPTSIRVSNDEQGDPTELPPLHPVEHGLDLGEALLEGRNLGWADDGLIGIEFDLLVIDADGPGHQQDALVG